MSGSSTELLVVGGGIGGLTTGLTAARSGRPVRVLERSAEFGEVGAGIQLAPNATRILHELGLLEEIREVGVLPRRLVLADAMGGGELGALDLTDFVERYGAPYVVMHRSDLLDILVRACQAAGVALETRADARTLVDDGAGVDVGCADGRTFRGTAVVAADGLHSRTRALFSDDETIGSGYVAYRGAVPMDQVSRHADLRDVVAWVGPGLHLVQYPLRSGRFYNQVAVFRSRAFGRGEPDWGNPTELDEQFARCCDHVRESTPLLGRDNRWPMYDRVPIPTWVTGRIGLLGDAAHPMLQYLAQGACQAIEDAWTLGAALRRHAGPSGDGVEAALLAYQAVRVPRTARVQRTARTWGEMWHVDGVGRLLRDELLRRRADDDHTYVEWLYGRGTDGADAVLNGA
ncbi:MAG: 3-hydroxybenzoate 6-monooxygenase [Actinomycetota bacterium]|nr:3-hydroxybenzoate 6-monooxygenase [Actinomycetota bacterium]